MKYIDKIRAKIEEYYNFLGIENNIDFSQNILLYCDEINSKDLEIFLSINLESEEFRILVYLDNKEIRNIKFHTLDEIYFFFIMRISEDYFKENIDFFSVNNNTIKKNFKNILKKQGKNYEIHS